MRVTFSIVLIVAMTAGAMMSSAASARPALRDVPEIDDGLLAVAIADEIRNRCDDISARMIRALTFVNQLESKAKALGYSDDEIDDYVTSKAEKARMRARGEAYLASKGVAVNDTAALCKLGKQEIAKGSQIGLLLRIW